MQPITLVTGHACVTRTSVVRTHRGAGGHNQPSYRVRRYPDFTEDSMKLRRAMAVAAATAVIAPATFLAAPAAFATPTPSASESTSPAPSESETTSPAPSESETTSPAPSESQTTSPAPSPSDSAPTEDPEVPVPPYCEELDEDFEEKALGLKISGLPGQIVAGSGW